MTKQDIIERAKRVSFSSNPKDCIDFVGELAKENETISADDQAARDYATVALRNRIGIPPDEAFKAGIAYERERLMKEAVECEIGWSDGYRIAPADENSMNEALAKIGVLDQVGAGVDANVSVIIIKKEK